MGKDFDKILKENFSAILLSVSHKFLGFKLKTAKNIQEKLQTTIEREPDFLKVITTIEGETFVLHLEFQTRNEVDMIFRMQEYHAILQRKFKLPIRQFVLYLGKGQSSMRTEVSEQEQFKGYNLINLQSIPYQLFIESEVPEEILLGILGNFGEDSSSKAIQQILQRLSTTSYDQISFEKYIRQLLVLTRLRTLSKETQQIVNDMPFTVDIENDYLYNKGIEKGVKQNSKSVIIALLNDGVYSPEKIAALTNSSLSSVLKIKAEIENNREK